MSIATAILATPGAPKIGLDLPKNEKTAAKFITWKSFQTRYLKREDGFKYEWVNGNVEKTSRNMDQDQYFIIKNLRNFFNYLLFSKKIAGGFELEIDTFFLENIHRRPDLSYFTEIQENLMVRGNPQIPKFIIEIISKNDQLNAHFKMQNYRAAGVEVVWMIFPNLNEVHVFSGEGLISMRVCAGDAICSAAPILPDFLISANDVFKKPE